MSEKRPPKTAKESAVRQWNAALDELPDTEWAMRLTNADIHDRRDRATIEEIIDREVPVEHHTALDDAFDDLRATFGFDDR